MKRTISMTVIILMLVFLTGCINVNTVIKLNPDGSGVIEETFLISKKVVTEMTAMMKQMAGKMGQAGDKSGDEIKEKDSKNSFDIFDEAELKEKALAMGSGVTYLSAEKIVTDKYEGYKAVYAFSDISKLKINQNPDKGKTQNKALTSGSGGTAEQGENITFQFLKGNPATLIIKLPDITKDNGNKTPKDKVNAPPVNKEAEEIAIAQMKKMFDGLKITMSIDVQGTIVETNALYRQNSLITLMEMDFGKLIDMKDKFEKFSQAKPETLEDAKKLMKDLPGIKVDLNKEIKIVFKPTPVNK